MGIKEKRKELGYSMKEISEMLHVPYRTWQDWEAGKSKPVAWAELLLLEKLDTIEKKIK